MKSLDRYNKVDEMTVETAYQSDIIIYLGEHLRRDISV